MEKTEKKIEYEMYQQYVTLKGDPVIYIGPAHKGVGMRLKCLSGNEVDVPPTYKLLPYDKSKINSMAKSTMQTSAPGRSKELKPKLAHHIDEYLLKGCHTVSEIVELLKDDPLAAGKNLSANVHARLVSYRRKNIAIQKSADGKVKVMATITGGTNETRKIVTRFSKRAGKTK